MAWVHDDGRIMRIHIDAKHQEHFCQCMQHCSDFQVIRMHSYLMEDVCYNLMLV